MRDTLHSNMERQFVNNAANLPADCIEAPRVKRSNVIVEHIIVLACGVCFYKIRVGVFIEAKKMFLVK